MALQVLFLLQEDSDDIYKKIIISLDKNQDELEEMSKNARRFIVENFDEEIVIQEYLDFLTKKF